MGGQGQGDEQTSCPVPCSEAHVGGGVGTQVAEGGLVVGPGSLQLRLIASQVDLHAQLGQLCLR